MRISHGERFIYFSIPKTASESVRAFLDPYSDETVVKFDQTTPQNPFYSHMRPLEARSFFIAWVSVRRLFPFCHRAQSVGASGIVLPDDEPQSCFPLEGHICRVADHARPRATRRWYAHGMMSVDAFVSDAAGKSLIDAAYRIEDELPRMCDDLSERVGRRIDMTALGQLNRARRSYDWREMYGPAERDVVARLYADETEQFSYDFPA